MLPPSPAEPSAPATRDELKALFTRRGLKVSDAQLCHLTRVVSSRGPIATWTRERDISRLTTVIVDEPPSPPRADALRRALAPDATVIIPFSENPAFDYLKSKLRCHGVIGASAPDTPHQVWWGGRSIAKPINCLGAIRRSHVVTCVRPNTPQDASAALFAKGLDIVSISYSIERDEAFVHCDDKPEIRSQLLLRAWDQCDKPLIWLDPVSTADLASISLNIDGADFAAVSTTSGLSTSLIYFGRSQAAHDLLKSWNCLCHEFASLPASYLLDAAWALISSQRPLVTQWLPPHHGLTHVQHGTGKHAPAVEHYMLTVPSQTQARRASRTGAPEPHYVMSSRFDGRGPLMLITTAEASAHDVAHTVESAVAAFADRDGGFSSLGIMICQNECEASDAIRLTNEGWILYALPGLILDRDAFSKVSAHAQTDKPVFIFPESYEQRKTPTGISLQATRAKGIFGRAQTFKTASIQTATRSFIVAEIHPQKGDFLDSR